MTRPCPICSKPVAMDGEFMPFCSERCQLLDLGAWASEKYSIPGNVVQRAEDDAEGEL